MAIDFRIKDFFYPIGIYKLRRTFERNQWLAPDALFAYQEKRLAVIINHAYNHVPYYHRLFKKLGLRPSDIKNRDDLKRLPILSKDIVRKERVNLIADNAKKYNPLVYKTSGTTGTPVEIYLDKNSNILEFVYYWRHWSWAGFKLGDRFAELGSFYFLQRDHLSEAISSWQPHFRRLMLNSGQISANHVRKMADAIRKHRAKFLKGSASAIYFLALCLKEAEIYDITFKAIFSNGEVLTPKYRALAESVFNCPILDSYGQMEQTIGASQCMMGGYHIDSDYGLLEFDNLRTSEDNRTILGRAIGTSLYNLAMPLIRYDVGDDIEFFAEPERCPCGRSLPLIKAIHGRSEDTIVTPDGRFITSMFIVPEFTKGARFVQFIQEDQTSLQINVVPDDSWNDEQRDKLVYYAVKLLGKDMRVSLHLITPDEIVTDSSGKIRSVISYVNACS